MLSTDIKQNTYLNLNSIEDLKILHHSKLSSACRLFSVTQSMIAKESGFSASQVSRALDPEITARNYVIEGWAKFLIADKMKASNFNYTNA